MAHRYKIDVDRHERVRSDWMPASWRSITMSRPFKVFKGVPQWFGLSTCWVALDSFDTLEEAEQFVELLKAIPKEVG